MSVRFHILRYVFFSTTSFSCGMNLVAVEVLRLRTVGELYLVAFSCTITEEMKQSTKSPQALCSYLYNHSLLAPKHFSPTKHSQL